MSSRNPVQEVLSKLEGVKHGSNGQYTARCPAHDDRHASLSIARGDDGRVLMHCHTGCTMTDILNALGIEMNDLFIVPGKSARAPSRSISTSKSPTVYTTLDDAIAAVARQVDGVHAGLWHYPGGSFCVGRFDLKDGGKTCRPFHRIEIGWTISDPPGALSLYISDELPQTGFIFIVEGEKCVDELRNIGLAAVTSAHGAQAAGKSDWGPLAGREVVILPDNDDGGRQYAQDVAAILTNLTPACRVRIVELPGLEEKGDICDWIDPDGPMGCRTAEEIKEAITSIAEQAKLWTPKEAVSTGYEPIITCLADVEPVEVEWLWPQRIALGKLTVVAGDPGLGKSFITLDMAARVSTGQGFPDCPDVPGVVGDVVLLSAEDGLADTIRPRLDAAKADVTRITAIEGIHRIDPDSGCESLEAFNLTDDLSRLEQAMTQSDNCRLVIIDPISAYLGGKDSHKNAEIRTLLMPLTELAQRRGVAIVAVNHLRKSEGRAIYRSMGSIGFVAAARAAYIVAEDKDDPDGRRRLLLPTKNNLGNDFNGLAYRLDDTGSVNGLPFVNWDQELVSISADEVLASQWKSGNSGALDEATEWLNGLLDSGPVPAKEVKEAAERDGISSRTLDRAKKVVGVVSGREGFQSGSRWIWQLPPKDANLPVDRQTKTLAYNADVGAERSEGDE